MMISGIVRILLILVWIFNQNPPKYPQKKVDYPLAFYRLLY